MPHLSKKLSKLLLSVRSWAIIRGVYIAKAMWTLHVHYYFVSIERLLFYYFVAFITRWGSINRKSSLRHLSTLLLDSKLILLSLNSFFLMWSASRMCRFCLLFCCSNIVVYGKNFPKSTREPINSERFIYQFPPDIIKSMRRLERINTIMYRQRMYQ